MAKAAAALLACTAITPFTLPVAAQSSRVARPLSEAAAKQAQQPEDERVEQTYTTRFVDMFAHARNQIPPGAALHPYVAINSLMARSFR